MLDICKEIIIFLMVAKLLESLQSGNKFGKYLKFIISLIVVLKLVSPILSVFESEFDFQKIFLQIEEKMELSSEVLYEEEFNVEDIVEIPGVGVKVEEIQWEK